MAGTLYTLFAQGFAGALETLPDAAYLQWSGGLESRSLDDGSVLNEYVSRTGALEEPDVTLSVRFVPRFDCSPLIGIRIAGAAVADIGSALGDGGRVTLAIDGNAAGLDLFVDTDESVTTLWMDAAAASRERLRRRIDAGSRAELELPGGWTIGFSLSGSRRSTAAIETACRTHEPLPYED